MAPVKRLKVGVIGAGHISYTYLYNLTKIFYITDCVGVADLIPERSKARASLFGIRQMTDDEILKDPEIEIVVNLTEIASHTEVSRMILNAGKNAYSEKMMGCTFEESKATVELAKSKGLRFGAAPDTFYGSAYQTARKAIDDGMIGQPIMAQAICVSGSGRHSLPEDFSRLGYGKPGTTIPYDMGGYYVHALLNLLGPVTRVSGYSRFNEDRVNTNPKHPRYGEPITKLAGPTMLMGTLEFKNGCYGNLVIMGEGFGSQIPRVEIFGTQGTLVCPDPNCFGGYGFGVNTARAWGGRCDVYMTRNGNEGLFKLPFTHGYGDMDPSIPPLSGQREPCHNSHRGIGVADMAWAIRRNRPQRSSEELALHAVEIITGIEKSCRENIVYKMTTQPEIPAPLAPGYVGADAERSLDT